MLPGLQNIFLLMRKESSLMILQTEARYFDQFLLQVYNGGATPNNFCRSGFDISWAYT